MKEKKWYLGSENKKQRGKRKNKKIDPRKNKETTSNAVCKNETSKMMSFSEYKKLVGVHKFSKDDPQKNYKSFMEICSEYKRIHDETISIKKG